MRIYEKFEAVDAENDLLRHLDEGSLSVVQAVFATDDERILLVSLSSKNHKNLPSSRITTPHSDRRSLACHAVRSVAGNLFEGGGRVVLEDEARFLDIAKEGHQRKGRHTLLVPAVAEIAIGSTHPSLKESKLVQEGALGIDTFHWQTMDEIKELISSSLGGERPSPVSATVADIMDRFLVVTGRK